MAQHSHRDRLADLRRAPAVLALVALFLAALAATAVSPAFADSQQVQVSDNAFTPPGVAVKPGESVTWTNNTATDLHNVNFEDGSFRDPDRPQRAPWTATRPFDTVGTFRYYCQEHGGPGGQGMSGIVHVNSTGTVPGVAPTASFTVSPGTARVGQSVAFNATGTTDPDPSPDSIIRHEWDFDGNGSFETDTGTTKSTSQTYTTAGVRTIKLRVTDSQGHTSETTRSLTVTDEPIASFLVSPSPAQTGKAVSFDGSASRDPDGTIARYEWDLDGNGSFETDTGTSAITSRSYTSPATLTVRLRVTDNTGVASETARSLQVTAPALSQPMNMAPLPIFPKPVACSTLKGARRTACMQKRCRTLKGAKRAACITRSCRYLPKRQRAGCRRKSCRFLKGTKKRACLRKYRARAGSAAARAG